MTSILHSSSGTFGFSRSHYARAPRFMMVEKLQYDLFGVLNQIVTNQIVTISIQYSLSCAHRAMESSDPDCASYTTSVCSNI